jgi:hypothetical protein
MLLQVKPQASCCMQTSQILNPQGQVQKKERCWRHMGQGCSDCCLRLRRSLYDSRCIAALIFA